MKTKNQNAKRLLLYLITACITLVTGIAVFRTKQIAPFGSQSVLCMDLWGQYFSMYMENAQAKNLSELFWSWNGAFGHNNWAQSAYYCNSIFLLFFKFIPIGMRVTALDIFCLLKIVFSSLACLAFLRHKLKSNSCLLVAGSVAYATCAYMLAFFSQFMWTDMLFYAPLILIGIDRLVYENKPVMYSIILAIAIISNFYIGFAICIFSTIYFAANALQLMRFGLDSRKFPQFSGFNDLCSAAVRFIVFSLIGGALSAVFIIPVGMAISNTLASEVQAPDKLQWYGSITTILQEMLSGQPLYVEYSGANLATTVIIFIALPVYFFNNKIRLTERLTYLAVFVFLLASLNCNLLDYMWHGFHFPNQLPGRWTFLFSLFTVFLIVRGLTQLKGMSPVFAGIGCAIGLIVFVMAGLGLGAPEGAKLGLGMWINIIVCCLAVLSVTFAEFMLGEKKLTRQQQKRQNKQEAEDNANLSENIRFYAAIVLTAVIIFDSCTNFVTVAQFEGNKGLMTAEEPGYTQAVERSDRNAKKWRSGSDDFYRVEANNGFTFNASMLGGYRGLRYYSSTMQGSVFSLLKFLGNRVYADKVSSVYTLSSPVQNSLFGIRYFMDFDRYLPRELPYTTFVEETADGNFLENTQALSVGYAVSDDILSFNVTDEIRAIQNQNTMLNAMLGEEANVFEKLETTYFGTENATLIEDPNWNQNYFQPIDGQQPVAFHYTYTAEKDGSFFMEHNYRAGTIHISSPFGEKDTSIGNGAFTYIGELKKGESVTIDVRLENIGLGCCGLNVYYLNKEKWDSAYEKLAAHQFKVTKFKNTKIEGTISLDEKSLVLATIPQDGGWSVYCDGKKVKTLTAADTFLCTRIPAGEHTLEYRYNVPGLKAGVIISIFGVIALAVYMILRKKRK